MLKVTYLSPLQQTNFLCAPLSPNCFKFVCNIFLVTLKMCPPPLGAGPSLDTLLQKSPTAPVLQFCQLT